MSVQDLLSRLEKVRKTGPETWTACCPAHGDTRPSLSIRECDDGRVLMHCFSGQCAVASICGAVGLDVSVLFPPNPQDHAKPLRRPFPAADILENLSRETFIVLLAARAIANGETLDEGRIARVAKAAGRIEAGRAQANG